MAAVNLYPPPPKKKKISRDRSRVPDPCRLVAAPCGWHARPAKHELSVRCDFLGYGPLLKREFRKWCSRSGLYNCFKMFCSHWNVPFFPLSSSFFFFFNSPRLSFRADYAALWFCCHAAWIILFMLFFCFLLCFKKLFLLLHQHTCQDLSGTKTKCAVRTWYHGATGTNTGPFFQ